MEEGALRVTGLVEYIEGRGKELESARQKLDFSAGEVTSGGEKSEYGDEGEEEGVAEPEREEEKESSSAKESKEKESEESEEKDSISLSVKESEESEERRTSAGAEARAPGGEAEESDDEEVVFQYPSLYDNLDEFYEREEKKERLYEIEVERKKQVELEKARELEETDEQIAYVTGALPRIPCGG